MAKRSEKNNWKKKRRQEYLEKKEFRYYIFCEGQATEPFYFQGFKQYIEDNPIYRDMVLIEIEPCQAEHRRFLKESKVPVVVIGQHTKYANCIYHDDYGAGEAMGCAVAAKSRKEIAYIGVSREDKAAGAAREDGFREGLKRSGKELKDGYYKVAEFTTESGYEKVLELLNEKHDIDIISCATDTIAAGAIEAIHTYAGSQIPKNVEDTGSRFRYILENTSIQVTGFGDNQLLKAVTGGIPTVHFGYKTSGIRLRHNRHPECTGKGCWNHHRAGIHKDWKRRGKW